MNKSLDSEDRDPVVNRITLTKKSIWKNDSHFELSLVSCDPKKYLEIRYIGEDRYILSNWDKSTKLKKNSRDKK